jgi:hypothetical protein
MIICHGEVLFWSSLFGVLEASSTWMGKTTLSFGKCSVSILLNILHIPLAYTSSPLSMPMILRSGFLMEPLSSCIFLSQLLSFWLRVVFFFNLYFILSSEILSSTCSTLLEWPSTIFFVFFNVRDFLFTGFPFDSFFWDIPDQLLFYILRCLLYFLYLFFYSVLCFSLVFVEVLSEFI